MNHNQSQNSGEKIKTWGLVLSGGAAYGMANIGVLRALENRDLRPDYIAGSSMGAIVGALYALGVTPDEMLHICEGIKMYNIATFSENPLKSGLHGGVFRQKITDILEPSIGDARIGDCKIPFVCIAGKIIKPIKWHTIVRSNFTDHAIECVQPHIFDENTKVMDALLASSAIPVIFSPVEIGGEHYIDMCHFGAVPARTLRDTMRPTKIIATCTNPRMNFLEKILPKSWKKFIDDGMEELEKSLNACDIVLEPEMVELPFRFDRAEIFAKEGERVTNMCISEIQSILNQ